jgi:hypothetical protein
MSKRGPDHQKREAKRSLWDMDGQHIPKKYRNKGKGRGKDKKLIQQELATEVIKDNAELLERLDDVPTETQE